MKREHEFDMIVGGLTVAIAMLINYIFLHSPIVFEIQNLAIGFFVGTVSSFIARLVYKVVV